jgi:hypothetical protein
VPFVYTWVEVHVANNYRELPGGNEMYLCFSPLYIFDPCRKQNYKVNGVFPL